MTYYEVSGRSRWPRYPPFTLIPEDAIIGDRVKLALTASDEAALVGAGMLQRLPEATYYHKVATTGVDGTALATGAGTLLSLTVPSDSELHSVVLSSQLVVSTTQVGGKVNLNYTIGGSANVLEAMPGGYGTGVHPGAGSAAVLVDPGSTVTVTQTAQSSGTAVLYAELWSDNGTG